VANRFKIKHTSILQHEVTNAI